MPFDRTQLRVCTAKLTRTLAIAASLLFLAAPLRAGGFAPLTGNHPDGAASLAGTAAPYQPLQMEIYLNPHNKAQLDQLVEDQQDPGSPKYHKFLTPQQYDQQFGATAADVSAITQWLESQGFTVKFASAHERRISFTGDVATAQSAFMVHIATSSDGKSFSNLEDPQVPASLAPKIGFLAGLDNLHGTSWNTLIPDPPYINANPTIPYFGPTDIRTFANETPLLTGGSNGAGQCIAVSEGSDVDQVSLAQFNTVFGLPAFSVGTNFFSVFPDGSPDPPGSEGGGSPYAEAMLDVEYAHGLAPGASIVIYAANAGTSASDPVQALVDTAIAATSDTTHHCYTVAVSWAQCGEPASFFKNLETVAFEPGASEGQSIFVATGDVGTAAPRLGVCTLGAAHHIEENAGSNYVTAVGASMYEATYDDAGNDTSTDATTKQEVWDWARTSNYFPEFFAGKGATTGGYSEVFLKPKWQKGVAGISGGHRAVPDLVLGGGNLGGKLHLVYDLKDLDKPPKVTGALFAAPGFWECFDDGYISGDGIEGSPEWEFTGGTSIVPPQYAAIFAIINQKSGASGQGLINPKLYAMAHANLKNLAAVGILDIVTGNNAYAPSSGYPAHKGFDLATGWGAIDITNFVNAYIAYTPPTSQAQQ
ncbi:MAG TPA: S53 family peptidase [Candidatus Binataceae bacterium]|nr:S53 family peptidase [Candidatus Binataceae bacterium]